MARYSVAPTKTNLLALKDKLAFAREGHELLTQKRDILIAELLGIMASAASAQRAAEEKLAEAFGALEKAVLSLGRRTVRAASWAVDVRITTVITERKVMGVSLPVITSSLSGSPPYYAFASTGFWLDEAQSLFRQVVELLDRVAETRISVIRLAREVRKTMRRVNALEKIYIPDYEETLHYIEEALEESDREAFFILKLIKARLGEK